MFRELTMVDTRELIRLWLKGYSDRAITRLARADRKTVKRYLEAARAAGIHRGGGEEQLGDEVLGAIAEALRPGRPGGHGPVWNLLVEQRSFVEKLLDDDLTLTKIHNLLTRQGVMVLKGRNKPSASVAGLVYARRMNSDRVLRPFNRMSAVTACLSGRREFGSHFAPLQPARLAARRGSAGGSRIQIDFGRPTGGTLDGAVKTGAP